MSVCVSTRMHTFVHVCVITSIHRCMSVNKHELCTCVYMHRKRGCHTCRSVFTFIHVCAPMVHTCKLCAVSHVTFYIK